VVLHGEPRVTPFGIFKGAPAAGQVNITLSNVATAGLRSRATAKGTAEPVFLINLDVGRDLVRGVLLN
jgi:hypothetical protein